MNKSFTFDQNIHKQSAHNEKVYNFNDGSIHELIC